MKDYSRTGADKLQPMGQTWSAACFGTVHSLKMVRAFFKKELKIKQKRIHDRDYMWLTKRNVFTIWPFTQKLLISALEYPETVHIGGFSHLIFLKNSYFLTFLRLCGRLNMVIIFFTFFPLVCVSAYWLWVGSVTPIRHWGHVLSQCWDQTLEKLAGSSFCFLGHSFWETEIPR